MTDQISLTCYSDVLCVWAHIAQARIDEVRRSFGDAVLVEHRFCSVFGDTAHKIGVGWADRGGYAGFGAHVRASVEPFDHVTAHPELWEHVRPVSSTPAHLVLKAVQRLDPERVEDTLRALRTMFFEQCADVADWRVLSDALEQVGVRPEDVRRTIDCGVAHADLEADTRDKAELHVQGSPTLILNEGRQKLYGNVGYGLIEANIEELLRSPEAGAASWC